MNIENHLCIYFFTTTGNAASSDSDSKGSIEADRDHQKKKRNSFRRKKNRDHPAQADDASPHHKPHLESRIYDMPGTFSPDEDEVCSYFICASRFVCAFLYDTKKHKCSQIYFQLYTYMEVSWPSG